MARTTLRYIWPITSAVLAALLLVVAFSQTFWQPAANASASDPASNAPPAPAASVRNYDVIQVTGTGRVAGVPDLATLQLGVSVVADTVSVARDQAAASLQSIAAALQANGIADSDMTTTQFRVRQQYDYSNYDGSPKVIGYEVSSRLRVTVRNIAQLGPVIDASIAAGGDHIRFDDMEFSFADRSELERQARQRAVADMQEKASQLAGFSGRNLGRLLEISETPQFTPYGVDFARQESALAAGAATPIAVGEDTVSVTIYGVYELR